MNEMILEEIKNRILDYCEDGEDGLFYELSRLEVIPMFSDEIKKISYPDYLKLQLFIMLNRIHQELYLDDLLNIAKNCKKYDVDIICLKGLSAAFELYEDPSIRISGDLDLLVRERDVYSLLEVCKQMGYSFEEGELSRERIEYHIKDIGHQHLPRIHRVVTKDGKKYILEIEVHLVLDPCWYKIKRNDGRDLTETIFSNSIKFNLFDEIYVCDMYDNFIFLLKHFFRHLHYEMYNDWQCSYADRNITASLKSLVDAILLVEKYKDIFDWDEVRKRAYDYNFECDVAAALKIANDFLHYPMNMDYIYSMCEVEMESYSYNYWRKLFCRKFIQLCDGKDIIIGKSTDIYKKITMECQKENPQYICAYHKGPIVFDDLNTIVIDEYVDKKQMNRHGTFVRYSVNKTSSLDFGAKVRSWWDDNRLYFDFDIRDGILKFKDIDNILWGESLVLFFYNPQFDKYGLKETYTGFFCTYVLRNGVFESVVNYQRDYCDKRAGVELDKSNYDYELAITEKGYTIRISILWKTLNIDPFDTDQIGVEFYFNNVDSDEPELNTVLSWSNPIEDWYNPCSWGVFLLQKPVD